MQYGTDQIIDTLTSISKDIIRQKFYEIKASDYVPHLIGEAKWSSNILFSSVSHFGGDFETGFIDTGASSVNLAETDIATSSIVSLITTWAKKVSWIIPQIEQAIEMRNLDLISEKIMGLKEHWDLGLQKSCFLGLKSNKNFTGLLNNNSVKIDTTIISKPISTMNFNEYKEFVAKLFNAYIKNSAETVLPNRLIVPSSDYYGLSTPISEHNPISRKKILEDTFKEAVGEEFRILPLLYGNKEQNSDYGIGKNRYVLYNYNSKNLRRDIPIDITQGTIETADGFNMNQIMYGQFSQVTVRRPRTILYFDIV